MEWCVRHGGFDAPSHGVFVKAGYCFGVPIIGVIVYWGMSGGPSFLGNYLIKLKRSSKKTAGSNA